MGSWFGLSGYLPQKYAQKDMERDMIPDNGGLEDDYPFQTEYFQVPPYYLHVGFRVPYVKCQEGCIGCKST